MVGCWASDLEQPTFVHAPTVALDVPRWPELVWLMDREPGLWFWWYAPQRALHKSQPRHTVISAPEILGHLFRLVAAVVSFEFVVVAVRVVGAFIVVVFVDEDAFLVGETLLAVLAAATPRDEQKKQPGG